MDSDKTRIQQITLVKNKLADEIETYKKLIRDRELEILRLKAEIYELTKEK